MPRKSTDRDDEEGVPIGRALILELQQLDPEERAPSDEEVAAAGDLIGLGDLAPPVVFDSGRMRLVRGRVLLAAAVRAGRSDLPAIDLDDRPELRRVYCGAWDVLAPLLASRDTFAAALARLERAAGEGLAPSPPFSTGR